MNRFFVSAEVKEAEDDSFEVIASSAKTDRYGDTINPTGWYLTNYRKNPVILWSHNTGGFGAVPPVGRADKVWVEDDKELKIKVRFADTPFAQELKTLVKGGFLNAVSVGFIPLVQDDKGMIEIEEKKYRYASDQEIVKSEKGIYQQDGRRFDKQELLEVSWVSVPALPSALVTARELALPLVTKAIEAELKEETINTEEVEGETQTVASSNTEEIDLLKNKINEQEEAIRELKEMLNPEKLTVLRTDKGRNQKTKSKAERILVLADKVFETLLKEIRKSNEEKTN